MSAENNTTTQDDNEQIEIEVIPEGQTDTEHGGEETTQQPVKKSEVDAGNGDDANGKQDEDARLERARKADHDVTDPTDEELEEYSAKVQKRMRQLTRVRHDERRRAEAAERERAELENVARVAMERNKKLQEYITMGQTAYIEKSKTAATRAMEIARSKLRTAYDAGDSEAIAAAQQDLTTAQLELDEANKFRAAPLQPEQETAYTPETTTTAQPNVDQRTQDWVKHNPWFQRKGDEDMTGYALSVHKRLVAEHGGDFVHDSAYYKQIDSAMRKAFPERFDESDATETSSAPANRNRPSTVVAPAQRSTTGRKVRLTQSQLNLASRFGLTPEQYAKELIALEKNNG